MKHPVLLIPFQLSGLRHEISIRVCKIYSQTTGVVTTPQIISTQLPKSASYTINTLEDIMATNPTHREGHFNPTSPHSSSGAADSFKGTPDTRLTAFSPDDGSAKSSQAPQSLSVGARENRALRFMPNPRSAIELPSSFVRTNLHSERDPFVSSSAPSANRPQKLSPTASVFLPYHGAPPSGTTSEPVGQQSEEYTSSNQGSDQHSISSPQFKFAHSYLSTDTGLSRCSMIADPGRRLRAHDVGSYLSVCQGMYLVMPKTPD